MSNTYATVADFKAYTIDTIPAPPQDAKIQRLLDNAARDVDWVAGAWQIVDTTTGAKFNPAQLPAYQAAQLNRATCAQAEYRHLHGESFMAKAQHEIVRLQDDTGAAEFRQGQLPYIGPKVVRELELGGLMRSSMVQMVSMGPRVSGGGVIANRGDWTAGDL